MGCRRWSSNVADGFSGGLGFGNPSGGGVTAGAESFVVAPGFADTYQAKARIAPNLIPGAMALPSLDSATLDGTDASRPKIASTTAGAASLAITDGGSIATRWSDTRADDRAWTFVVAPGATRVKAPAIPASADAWLPQAAVDGGTASSFDVPEVTFVETDLLAGYQPLNEWPPGWVESFTSHGGKLARSPQRRQERRKVVK